ncbi:ATP-binding cassette subfamily B protein AbcA/BmrA [Tumebacillus sp. BK434]|uniref:ABC transporter ATP-binding protein n=1 Tax=Tumebacillus sp. BK434 TaxID=2512169 RepID=UPI00104EB9F5|nr:ABC transporter ATP-binding protein [Tumebacillus sp. BK434]TCP57723.1 ATP-binding cassette subfamily B protein AbcA/BmrA [Tumebacillus sp. BK434]
MNDEQQAQPKAIRKDQWRAFLRLITNTNPPKLLLAAILLLSLINTGASLIVPWFTKNLVDVVSVSALNTSVILLLIFAFLLQGVSAAFSHYMLSYVGQTVVANLRRRLWQKLLALPIPYFDKHRSGETISRMTSDTGIIKDIIVTHMISFFTSIISIVGSVVILLYLDWQMTLVMLSAVPITFLVIRPMGRKMYLISKGLQDEMASFTALLTQVLQEIRLVKSFNAEARENKSGEAGIRQLFQFGLKEAKVQAVLAPLMTFLMMAILVVIIGFGGVRVATGALSVGELVAFILYLFQIIMPFGQLAQFFTSIQKAMGATERLTGILEHEEEDHTKQQTVDSTHLPICVEDLTFTYQTGDEVLHGVDITFLPGKVTAIVGPSGSGKTTLFSLLERFYLPNGGTIRLGDTPIDAFSLKSWREQLGYVSQESPLMAGTIRDNIAYGVERAVTEEELQQAAGMAYADSFIQELPQGYDTEVGERGIKLSGGQRQRIAIARALLRNPNILMLDEATSALDSTSEKVVQDALANLMHGRTTLVIAHRLSTVVDADQIVVLEKGRVTGVGTHEELLATHELYRELATQQFQLEEAQA